MHRSEAKRILRKIQSINDCRNAANLYQHRLEEIKHLKQDLGLPKSPPIGGIRIENKGYDKTSKLLDLYFEEDRIKKHVYTLSKEIREAEGLRDLILKQIKDEDLRFASSYLQGINRDKLRAVFGYENPYGRMLTLLADVDLFIN